MEEQVADLATGVRNDDEGDDLVDGDLERGLVMVALVAVWYLALCS